MGFKRPRVRISTLGPKNRFRKKPVLFCCRGGLANSRPLAFQFAAKGRARAKRGVGLEFESRHSDHKRQMHICAFAVFILLSRFERALAQREKQPGGLFRCPCACRCAAAHPGESRHSDQKSTEILWISVLFVFICCFYVALCGIHTERILPFFYLFWRRGLYQILIFPPLVS